MTITKKALRASPPAVQEMGLLVSEYYMAQGARLRTQNQMRTLRDVGVDDFALLPLLHDRAWQTEKDIKKIMEWYAEEQDPVCRWAIQFRGIGPIIPVAMRAYADFTRPHPAQVRQFFGLTPAARPVRGQRRNYSSQAKRIILLAADSFMKQAARFKDRLDEPESFYLKLWLSLRADEERRNERGEFAHLARQKLEGTKGASEETRAYWRQGKLRPDHVLARAKRRVAQIFLDHFHRVARWHDIGETVPYPYPIALMGHAMESFVDVPLPPPGFPVRPDQRPV